MRKFFITGVSSGLGLELMKQLVDRGDFVYGVSRTKIPEDNFFKTSKDKCVWFSCDITKDCDIQRSIEHQKSINFIPDIVILNAGVHSKDERVAFGEFEAGTYKKLFRVNCFGALKWVNFFLKTFKKRDKGHFVYISSLAVFYPFPLRVNYSATKSYTSIVFECLRERYCATRLSFSVFYPGRIDTEGSAPNPVPRFLKFPVFKAAKKILETLPNANQSIRFPFSAILQQRLMALVPKQILLAILNRKKYYADKNDIA
jgi:short-subunit dehydrogenase